MIQSVIIWQKPDHEKREGGRAGVTNVDCCPSQRMFPSLFVVSDLQSDTYYYQDL
jgi:hypothetical protein